MNFPLILFILLIITGGIWLLDAIVWKKKRAADESEPWWVEYPKSFFPIILIVFSLRSIRLPVINKKILDINEPQRGDVLVFRYPEDPSIDYIKRIVGLPGDTITYHNKQLIVNGEAIRTEYEGDYKYVESGFGYIYSDRYSEYLNQENHSILINQDVKGIQFANVRQFEFRENCK